MHALQASIFVFESAGRTSTSVQSSFFGFSRHSMGPTTLRRMKYRSPSGAKGGKKRGKKKRATVVKYRDCAYEQRLFTEKKKRHKYRSNADSCAALRAPFRTTQPRTSPVSMLNGTPPKAFRPPCAMQWQAPLHALAARCHSPLFF